MIDISELKFDKNGLIPAVVTDAVTKKVLTLAYMNRESLEISMEKKLTCFYSVSFLYINSCNSTCRSELSFQSVISFNIAR